MTPDDLRAFRTALEWSQEKMAEEIGISRRQYQDIEAGRWPIRRTQELAIERVLFHEAVERCNLELFTPAILADSRRYAGILAGVR